ncbi:hypothetical protein GCM10022243_48020 [Saccharothrix violaceirubra]|uniref:Uncharacterized protein n=1 Tax=Saccharothrix violaceirubra TaxID=413306 RepID=A0A7W7WU65_9PSEU|nr:hypothetical protein [Saccharothrix violaceirubra]MBB4963856.1 hypothetical protein [Saccharothrix violaceirubra]
MRVLGREPAYWMSLCAALLALAGAFGLPLTVEQQGLLNALLAAVFGAITAALVAAEKSVPALVGVFKAAIAVGLAFGLRLAPEVQASALVVVELVLTGLLVRPNVVASVPPSERLAMVGPDGVQHATFGLRG